MGIIPSFHRWIPFFFILAAVTFVLKRKGVEGATGKRIEALIRNDEIGLVSTQSRLCIPVIKQDIQENAGGFEVPRNQGCGWLDLRWPSPVHRFPVVGISTGTVAGDHNVSNNTSKL